MIIAPKVQAGGPRSQPAQPSQIARPRQSSPRFRLPAAATSPPRRHERKEIAGRGGVEMSGSAFNAFKSRVPVAWSPRLYITLVRGLPGTRRLHRRTLEAMRLRRCHRTVEHRTTPSLLGMLTQVKRLVAVETEEMYNARKQAEAERRALRPPLVVSHHPPPPDPKPAAAAAEGAAATAQ